MATKIGMDGLIRICLFYFSILLRCNACLLIHTIKKKQQQTSIVNWSMAKKNLSLTIVKLLLFVAAGTKFKWRKKKIPIFSYWSYFKLSCHTLYKLTRWTHYYLSYFFYFYRFSFDNLGVISLCVVWCSFFCCCFWLYFSHQTHTHMYRIVSSLSNELKYK